MSAIDLLLAAPDAFALLGIDRAFDVDESLVATRGADLLADVARSADPRAAAAAARLGAARDVLADPERRADLLLTLLGGPGPDRVPNVPGAVRDALDDLRRRAGAGAAPVAGAIRAFRQSRIDRIAALFRALRGHDNPIVQRTRLHDLRVELNALAALRDIEATGHP